MTTTEAETSAVAFPVRSGRNIASLILLVPLTVAALVLGLGQAGSLGLEDWWIAVFPALTGAGVYRLVRRRVPLLLDRDGIRLSTGHRILGLRTTIPWREVKRLRIIASGLLLIDLHDSARWGGDKPWLVRANLRTNERRYSAAVMQPLRELAGTPQEILARLRAAAPVKVTAPEGFEDMP